MALPFEITCCAAHAGAELIVWGVLWHRRLRGTIISLYLDVILEWFNHVFLFHTPNGVFLDCFSTVIIRHMHFLAVTPLPPILELERPLYSKHFDRGTHLTCWVHQGILWYMLFNRLPPSFLRAMDKQTVV